MRANTIIYVFIAVISVIQFMAQTVLVFINDSENKVLPIIMFGLLSLLCISMAVSAIKEKKPHNK
ncbi:MAG: hypothetical protein RR293_08570 [Bacteroidales bacterium]